MFLAANIRLKEKNPTQKTVERGEVTKNISV